jgi:hypothetical protein
MKKKKTNDKVANMARIFLLGELSRGQVAWATSNPQSRNLPFGELQLEGMFL